MLKRMLDIIISLFTLTLALPLLLIVSVAIYLSSPGPIFFKQKRIGLGGSEFNMFKFRSMVANAEKKGPYFTSENDPRITKVGAFLRRTSLDEIPQILNVLKGDMSIVGPRPNVMSQKELYTEEFWNYRNSVRPGITGLAQATRRSDATAEERDALDREYIEKSTVIFDLKIIMQTAAQIIKKGGN